MTAAAVSSPRPEVLLIDLSSLYWTSWHATSANSSSEAAKLTQTAIDRCIGELDGKLVAICVDQGKSFRKELAPEYKANRPEKDQSALNELANLKERLRERGYWLAGADGFEADDVIATLAHAASAAGHPVRIASADKDLLQLLALPETTALRTHTWTSVRAVDVVTKFGVEPEGLRDWLALVGDKSDNVAGCPGVGEKRATELLVKFFDLDRLYDAIDKLAVTLPGADAPIVQTMTPEARKVATPAIVQALWDNREAVKLARKLVTLRTDAPVKFDDIYQRRESNAKLKGTKMETETEDDEPEDKISTGPGAEPAPPPPPAATPPTEEKPATIETRAIAVSPGVTYERSLEPRSPDGAMRIAEALYESRAFTRFPTAQSIFAAMVGGRELGLGCIASANAFHFMAELGCLALKAHTIGELAMRNPKCKYLRLTHTDEFYAEYEGWHVDHPKPYVHKYKIQDAVDAGLCGLEMIPRTQFGKGTKDDRGQWDKRRKQMLRKTCLTQIVTILWPGSSMGFYSVEELSEGRDE